MLTLMALMAATGCTSGHPGELYQRYASQPGLTVAEVCSFALCDTVEVDVVLVEAESEEAWQQLAEELGVRDDDGSTSWLATTADPSVRVQWADEPVLRVVASPSRRTVGFYTIADEAQYDALIDYQLNNMVGNG